MRRWNGAPWARDWPKIRARVLRRDPTCRCVGCDACSDGCTRESTEVDHVTRGDDHRERNLQGLCSPCSASKTVSEQPRLVLRTRPSEAHPGLL